MSIGWNDRSLRLILALAFLGAASYPCLAQKGAGSSNGGGATTGVGGSSGNIGTSGSLSRSGSSGLGNGLSARALFLSGRVLFGDGAATNANIRIERVCGGTARLEAHTDSKGRFSFQVGQDQSVDTDASNPVGNVRAAQSGMSTPNSGPPTSNSMDPLWNCELRAAYPGYSSDLVELGTRRTLDDPNVGTILLHPLANVKGSTVSVTSELAPKHAQKDYEKGVQLAGKGDFQNAQKRLEAATDGYPKYAIAWFALGQIEQKQGKNEDARKAWQNAAQADGHYVSPLDALASIALAESKWQEAADYSKQATDLNPVEFPNSLWCNAFANYQLKKFDQAQARAKDLLKLDTAHQYPKAEDLLGRILVEKGSLAEAAVHLRAYLTLAPNAEDAAALRQVLEKIDQGTSEAKK